MYGIALSSLVSGLLSLTAVALWLVAARFTADPVTAYRRTLVAALLLLTANVISAVWQPGITTWSRFGDVFACSLWAGAAVWVIPKAALPCLLRLHKPAYVITVPGVPDVIHVSNVPNEWIITPPEGGEILWRQCAHCGKRLSAHAGSKS